MNCEHIFILDQDGQVTCSGCGCRDDEMVPWKDPYYGLNNLTDFE